MTDPREPTPLSASTRLLPRWILAAVAVVGISGASMLGHQVVVNKHIGERFEKAQERDLGILVAVCAIQNVPRIEMQNFLTRLQNDRLLSNADPAALASFFEEERRAFGQVDCKALVPKEDRVNIVLHYPTTIPPPTVSQR